MDTGLVLEEVEMSLGPVKGVVNLAFLGLFAGGTRELRALHKIDLENSPDLLFGKLEIDNLLGLGKTEG
jgi:hypothetical protein